MPPGALRPLKASERIALTIVREIVERGLKPGDPLPREADMIEQYGASRASVREALRLLEIQGLIEIRRGSHVGTTVGEARAANLARALTLYFHMAGVSYQEVFEAWQLTEPLLAESAARSTDREKASQLLAGFTDLERFTWEEVVEFHSAVFDLASNRALAFMVRAFGMLSAIMMKELESKKVNSFGKDFRQIAMAIIEGDTAIAKEAMSQHIISVMKTYEQAFPDKVGALVTSSDQTEMLQIEQSL